MNRIYEGKTKDVYDLGNGQVLLRFKDDVTGENGVFDPGANTVGLSIEGMGQAGLRLSVYFFEKINTAGIPTHFVAADLDKAEMTALAAEPFGKGIEVVCRYRAVGSFLRRYGDYAVSGQALDALVEVTLKDDERGDPLITEDSLEELKILEKGEYQTLKALTKRICGLIRDDLLENGLELYDIKLEFGKVNGNVVLIDEISGGNMRVYRDGTIVEPLDLVRIVLG